MRVRARSTLCGHALGAALAILAGAFANAQTAVPGQDEMNIVDQPGYQPTPDEEQLTGAFEKQEVFFRAPEAPGTVIIDTKVSASFTWCKVNNRAHSLWYRRWPRRLPVVRPAEHFAQAGVAGLAAAAGNDRAPALSAAVHGRRSGQSARARARMYLGATVYRIHGTNQPETIGHAVSSGLFPPGQRRRRSTYTTACRSAPR